METVMKEDILKLLSGVEQFINPHGVLITIVEREEREIYARSSISSDSLVSVQLSSDHDLDGLNSITVNDVIMLSLRTV
jgi:hypothetical protein